jgi:hypothetical protein
MGFFIGLILVAAGAILVWGVTGTASGIDIDAVGVILIVVGLVAILVDMIFWTSWGPGLARRRRVVAEGPAYDRPVYEERRYVESRPVRRVTEVEEERAAPPPP